MSITRLYNGELSEREAKIAALWFDEVMIHSFSKSYFVDYLTDIYSISRNNENILRSIFTDVKDDAFSQNQGENILYSTAGEFIEDKRLLEISRKVISEIIGDDYKTKQRDVIVISNNSSYCIEKWKQLNSIEQCAFIGEPYESKILQSAYIEPRNRLNTNIAETVDLVFPSVSELSWDEVLDLRNHRFIDSFRKTINDLLVQLDCGDQNTVREVVDELVNKSIKEVFSLTSPSIKKQIIKGILSNIPLNIPNPVSIASSLSDIYKDGKLEKKYGWLFFYVENLM